MVIEKSTVDICNKISKEIVSFFGVDIDSIYVRKGTEKMQNAREFTWYILHFDYNISCSVLSTLYSKEPRTIKRGYAKIKHGIANQKYYQNIHSKLKEHLDKTIGQSN